MSYTGFQGERRTRRATPCGLEIAGEAVERLPPDVPNRHRRVPWRRVARFRAPPAHGDLDLDPSIVREVTATHRSARLRAAEDIRRNEATREANP